MGFTVVGRSLVVAVVACAALALAGCGGSSASGTGAGGQVDPAVQMARCMRGHGVPSFADPAVGAPLVIPNDINPDAPAFQSAQRTCSRLLPGGGPGGPGAAPSESVRLFMLRVARCLRAHGLPTFPDPTSTPPPEGDQSGALALGRGGWFLVVSDPQAPAFRRAAAVCHFPLPHPRTG